MAVKMTFSLDEATAERLRLAAEALGKPKSEVVRDAIQDYAERLGKLSEVERLRLLEKFDRLVPALPPRSEQDVALELQRLRETRRGGGRRSAETAPS